MCAEATQLIALAGLLHDIGKFMLRAAEGGMRTWDQEAVADFRYKHAMLTASFVDRHVPVQWRRQVTGPAGNHHRPQSRADRIVQLADVLSAAERDDGSADDKPRVEHPRQLVSIFSLLTADDHQPAAAARRYWPLQPLHLSEAAFFPSAPSDGDAVWRDYAALWQGFAAGAEQLRLVHEGAGDLASYLESMQQLLQRYTWCIPSAYYRSVPDISLYDHGRMTAALAAVLERPAMDEAALAELHKSFDTSQRRVALLVGVDISGVQNFIYTISSRGATPALRGRSFYLQLLMEALARYLLQQLELPITNLIYAGGGKAYLLARPDDKAVLAASQQAISRAMLQHHRGDLYVGVAAVPLAGEDFAEGRIGARWGALHEELQASKQRRFAELDPQELAQLFTPHGSGGSEAQLCHICGQEHQQIKVKLRSNGEPVNKCISCQAFEKLGNDLRRARYLEIRQHHLGQTGQPLALGMAAGTWKDVLCAFGMEALLYPSAGFEPLPEHSARRVVLALDDDALDILQPAPDTATGRRFLVNTAPELGEEGIAELMSEVSESTSDVIGRGRGVRSRMGQHPVAPDSHRNHVPPIAKLRLVIGLRDRSPLAFVCPALLTKSIRAPS